MRRLRVKVLLLLCFPTLLLLSVPRLVKTQNRGARPPAVPGPMLKDGTEDFDTPDFKLTLVRSSQTVAALKPKSVEGFDFTPGDILVERSQDGFDHLGDIDLRVRTQDSGDWKSYSTAVARVPVTPLPASAGDLASSDLAPTLPPDIPLQITRTWAMDHGNLVLRFAIKNKTATAVQIGALGIPMVFNNDLANRTLDQAHAACSFYDPYIGEDAGYLQVTRLTGHGPALVVVPDGHTPFEAYGPILGGRRGDSPQPFTDRTPRGVTFEGFYDWMVSSQAFAENEWKKAEQWNPPTTLALGPGESKTFGLRFLVSGEIRGIEQTLASSGRPVAVGIPGYVLPMDMDVRLFLKYPRPVKTMTVEPAGAVTIRNNHSPNAAWNAYTLRGKAWGRARLTVTYQDGLVQTIQYRVMKPEAEAVADMGHFLTTKQWFDAKDDPFHRAPSPITYDRELNQMVSQDSRVWIAGLSDEGGAGSWLASAMKEIVEPNKEEIDKLQGFVDGVLWGGIQFKDTPKEYGVRKSLFYYQPDELPANFYRSDLNWTSWTSWNKKASEAVDRSYDYPHVAAAYWVLYRLARNHQGLVTNHPWEWYLEHAYRTSIAMTTLAPGYARFGQMEGDIFLEILRDLKLEGRNTQADDLEGKMRNRADRWRSQAYPFGSEMPWDSTGQEEVYAWTKYFGYKDKADVTLNAVLGYMPTIPHWGYNGSARRYWDFIYGASAKYSRIERQLHHYGSGINAIPVLSEYRDHPYDLYLLRVGYGGTMGAITNIDQEGFASAAFHSFPDMLKFDPLTGDYGPNFYGHAMTDASYLVHHPEFGWVAFGGNLAIKGDAIKMTVLDSSRSRVYVAPLGLWLTLDAGTFSAVELNSKTGVVHVEFAPGTQYTSAARLRVEQPAAVQGVGKCVPVRTVNLERGAYVIPLGKQITAFDLNAK